MECPHALEGHEDRAEGHASVKVRNLKRHLAKLMRGGKALILRRSVVVLTSP
ncbi:MAG: hypothetical protein RXS23_06490 [Metallosphaera yellowstonensis]